MLIPYFWPPTLARFSSQANHFVAFCSISHCCVLAILYCGVYITESTLHSLLKESSLTGHSQHAKLGKADRRFSIDLAN